MTRTIKIFRYKIVKDDEIHFCNDHRHITEMFNIPRSSMNLLVTGKKMRKYPNYQITRCKMTIDEINHYKDTWRSRIC